MLECRYASSIYYNQENGYTVAVYETEDEIPEGKKEIGKQQFIAVGCELPRNEGLDISLKGQWKESERYGKQYHVASFEIQMPTTGEGVPFFRIDQRGWTYYRRKDCRPVREKYLLCL